MSGRAVSCASSHCVAVVDMLVVRHSAKELTSLIMDEERLRAERTNRGSWKSRVTGLDDPADRGQDAPQRGHPVLHLTPGGRRGIGVLRGCGVRARRVMSRTRASICRRQASSPAKRSR